MKFVDFFAGIGGIRLGLEQAGHKCVGFCEFDKYARTAYKAMYDTKGGWENHDVRTVGACDVPDADLWCFGFPCQDISVAGKQKACKKVSEADCFTKLCDCLPAVGKKIDPNGYSLKMLKIYLALETDLTSRGCCLKWGGYGYSLQWQVLNSKDFGVPQNRERVFIVGYLGDISGREVFPLGRTDGENSRELKEITQGVADVESGGAGAKTGLYAVKVVKPFGTSCVDIKIKANDNDLASTICARDYKGISNNGDVVICVGNTNPSGRGQGGNVLTSKHCGDQTSDCSNGVVCMNIKQQKLQRVISVAPTLDSSCRNNLMQNQVACAVLTPDRAEMRQNGRRIKEPGEPSFTLTAQNRHGVAIWRNENEYATEGNTREILRILRQEIGEKAFSEWGIAILAPFQQAEILQQRVHEKGIFEKRCQQSDFQQCAYNSEIDKQNDNKAREMSNLWFYEELRCASQGWEFQEQFHEQLDNAMQKLSHEAAPPKIFMQSMWEASQGIGVLRKALSTVQEIWRPFSLQWAEDVRIRRLTPREVWRLQGFPNEYFDKARAAGISDTQLYKTAGNGVTVNVARAIGERLKEIEEND